MTGLERRALYGVHLVFSEAFDFVSQNTLIDTLMKYRLDKWTVSWTENWLICSTGCDQQHEVQLEASH